VCRPHRKQGGFTLLEISVVLLIIGLLIALVIPRLPDITSSRLQASADKLAVTMGYLSDEAALRGHIYRLSLDLDGGGWEVRVTAPYATGEIATGFVENWDPYIRSESLPPEVRFESVDSGTNRYQSGIAELFFTPDGNGLPVKIVLSGNDEAYTVSYDPLSGRTGVFSGRPIS